MRSGNTDKALWPEKPLLLKKKPAADAPGGNPGGGQGNKRHHMTQVSRDPESNTKTYEQSCGKDIHIPSFYACGSLFNHL